MSRADISDAMPAGRSTWSWGSVEVPGALAPRPEIAHVLFDFDGTLSLIRQGWPEVMIPMFLEALPRLGSAKVDRGALARLVPPP